MDKLIRILQRSIQANRLLENQAPEILMYIRRLEQLAGVAGTVTYIPEEADSEDYTRNLFLSHPKLQGHYRRFIRQLNMLEVEPTLRAMAEAGPEAILNLRGFGNMRRTALVEILEQHNLLDEAWLDYISINIDNFFRQNPFLDYFE